MSPIAYYGIFYSLFFGLLLTAYRYRPLERLCQGLVWLLLTLFSGLRVGVGRDYLIYVDVYTNVQSPTNKHIEPLWNVINTIFRYFEIPMHIWLICIAGATYALMLYGFRRWRVNWILGILCYVLIYRGFFESMNTVRQCLAAAILFAGATNILSGRYLRFWLWVFVASLFHASALIGGVLLLVASQRWSARWLYVGLVASLLVGLYLFPLLIELLQAVLPGKYTVYLNGEAYLTEASTGLYRIFLCGFGLWLIRGLAASPQILMSRRMQLYSKMLVFSIFIYNALYVFEPGVRLMFYPFMAIFYFFPLSFAGERGRSRWGTIVFFMGLCVFSFKSLFAPNEPYIHYQTVFERSLPLPDVHKEVQNTVLD